MNDPDRPPDLADPSLYQRILSERGRFGAASGSRSPRASASVVLWRRAGPYGIEVYWVRRADSLPFMGGWYAFPGGGLSKHDPEIPVEGVPQGLEQGGTTPGLPEPGTGPAAPDLVPGLTACVLRELFEETGILVVRELLPGRGSGPVAAADTLDHLRRRLLAGKVGFDGVLSELGVTPDASPLVFAGRWLTPPFAPLRFDNRFFLLEWPEGATLQPTLVGGELAEGEWISPAVARRRWERFEALTAPPILHLLKVLDEDGPAHGLSRMREPHEANIGPCRRIEFRPGVLLVPLATATLPPATHTNAYLVGGSELALIDPGTSDAGEIERLERALEDLAQRHHQRVTAIWLTHHHPDHIGAVAALRERLGVPVLAHPETVRRLQGSGITVDDTLTDGQTIHLAGRSEDGPEVTVRVIHTPGHAQGHLCFFEERGGSLIAGDMVAGISTIVIDPPEGDMDAYLDSLRTLIELQPRTLFPAHGPTILHAVAKLQEYLDHRLWREQKVLEAWNDGQCSAREMLPRVYDDAPKEAWPLAERQIEAHLQRLRRAGRL